MCELSISAGSLEWMYCIRDFRELANKRRADARFFGLFNESIGETKLLFSLILSSESDSSSSLSTSNFFSSETIVLLGIFQIITCVSCCWKNIQIVYNIESIGLRFLII